MDPFKIDESNRSYIDFIERDESLLADYASKSKDAKCSWVIEGQDSNIDLSKRSLNNNSFLTPFNFDTYMIMFSKSWAKLQGKTQIFVAPTDLQFITRSAHTGYVVQVADQLANGLCLNRDLTRAIASGHDVGHTAFGHPGEYELEAICQEHFCFTSYKELLSSNPNRLNQLELKYGSLRNKNLKEIVPVLERVKEPVFVEQLKREFYVQNDDLIIFSHAKQSFRSLCVLDGKQLTAQTVHGIIAHQRHPWGNYANWSIIFSDDITRVMDLNPLKGISFKGSQRVLFNIDSTHSTYEGQVVKFADFLSFSIHDIDDGLRAGIISIDELRQVSEPFLPGNDFDKFLIGPQRYTFFINQFQDYNRKRILDSESFLGIPEESREILNSIYVNITKPLIHNNNEHSLRTQEARRYVRGLYDLWINNDLESRLLTNAPHLVPELKTEFRNGYSSLRKFCDFIAALTDRELIEIYQRLYSPQATETLLKDL